jgi:hypothetical protein
MTFFDRSTTRLNRAATFAQLKAEWEMIWLDDNWFKLTIHQQELIEHCIAMRMMANRWGD